MQQTITCPDCGSQNDAGLQFCVRCGRRLQYNCPYCGTSTSAEYSFCRECGAEQPWSSYQQPELPSVEDVTSAQQSQVYRQEKPERKKTSVWTLVLLGSLIVVLLVAGSVFVLYVLSQQMPGTYPTVEGPIMKEGPALPQESPPVASPVIVTFDVTPEEVTAAEPAMLSWEVSGADSVTIDQGIGEVPHSGTRSVTQNKNTVYTLTATNTGGSVDRSIEVAVIENVNAAKIALKLDDVSSNDFIFYNNSEPMVAETISTYYIKFVRGDQTLDNAVSVHTTVAAAEKRYYEIKFNNRENIQDIIGIGERGYFLSFGGEDSEGSVIYSIRFQKNNVYVTIGGISNYEELESYARIVAGRIQ